MKDSDFPQLQGSWISDFKTGSQSAFKILYDCTCSLLYGWLFNSYSTITREEIEDTIAEVYLRVFKRREMFENEDHIRRSLYMFCKNILIDRERKKKSERKYCKYILNTSDEEDIPFEEFGGASSREVEKAIINLPEKMFWVVYFSFFRGFTSEEVADCMEVSTQTVLNERNRAIIKLRKQLAIRILPHKHIVIKKAECF